MPDMASLRKRTSTQILQALETGVMQSQGGNLTAAQRSAVAGYLGIAPVVTPRTIATNRCAPQPDWSASQGWDSWGGGPENRRFQANGGLPAADVPRLKLRWAFAVPNATAVRSQPAVSGGRVFFGGQDGNVYALDAKTGCTHWEAKIPSQVRSGIALVSLNGKTIVLVGDVTANVTAIDAATGTRLWSRKVDDNLYAMITSTPLVIGDRIYLGVSSREESEGGKPGYICCTFRGSAVALNLADGTIVWKTWSTSEPPSPRGRNKQGAETLGPSGAGIWGTPTWDRKRGLLYFVTGDNYSDPTTETSDALLALDPKDGRILWSHQYTSGDAFNVTCFAADKVNCPDSNGPDHDFGSSAILTDAGTLLLAQKSGVLRAVDPDRRGYVLWEDHIGKGGPLGGIQWGPASDGKNIYVALSDVTVPGSAGGLFALSLANGERLWQTPNTFCGSKPQCRPAQSGAVTAIPGIVFSGSLDGHLRAYAANSGKIVWDYDTAHEFPTVNGVKGIGGSLDSGGPVIAGGMVFAGSGYGAFGSTPGNVLLAFGPE